MTQEPRRTLRPDQFLALLESKISEMAAFGLERIERTYPHGSKEGEAYRAGFGGALSEILGFARQLHDGQLPAYRYRCGNCNQILYPLTTNDALNVRCDQCADSPPHIKKERIL